MLLPRLKVGDCSHSDNAEALSSFIVNDMPDPVRLFEIVGGLIPKSRQRRQPASRNPALQLAENAHHSCGRKVRWMRLFGLNSSGTS